MSQSKGLSYELKIILLLSIGFALVGVDRFVIVTLFPVMMDDLGLDYRMLGSIASILGITWGIFSIITGNLSDKIGRRKVLIPSIIMFSLFGGLSGAATGFVSLMIVRGIIGTFEGAYTPTSIAAIQDVAPPRRRGLYTGMQQSVISLVGVGLTPIIAVYLLQVLPSWKWVFPVVALPGLIVAFFMYRWLREPEHIIRRRENKEAANTDWRQIFKYRNVIFGIFALLGVNATSIVLNAMMPNYIVDYLNIQLTDMGFITSALGFGGFLGAILLPFLSDRIGRKPVLLSAGLATILLTFVLAQIGPSTTLLFLMLFLISFFMIGCNVTIVGPVLSESVPPVLIATAVGIPIGLAEIFGGGAVTLIAGFVAQTFGIHMIPYVALAGITIAFISFLFLKETAPHVISKKQGEVA